MRLGGRLLVPGALAANAVLQGLLALSDPTPELSAPFAVGALLSGLAWLATYVLVVGRVVAPDAVVIVVRRNGARFAAWAVGLGIVVGIALIPLGGVLGFVILAATPYVPIAAMLGESNPVSANFRTISRAPWAFAWRIVVLALLLLAVLLAAALNAFFVTGMIAAAVNSLALGAVGWVITRSFAHEYRVAT